MHFSSDFVALLPTLRRYGRALTGSQETGDGFVFKTFEWLGKSPVRAPDICSRTAAYRTLTQLWQVAIGQSNRETNHDRAAVERIAQLDGLPRQAFLLVGMEKFSPKDAAHILAISERELCQQIAIARLEIASHVATDVLIIEDDLFMAVELEGLVVGLGLRVAGKARTHEEAVDVVTTRPPGLILSDIQLADDSSGIDAVTEILRNVSIPIIFVTGCQERLLTGQRPDPTFLIEKPFKPDEIRTVITQAFYFSQNETAANFQARAFVKLLSPNLRRITRMMDGLF